jgi:L-alanine-DL-glutamate epimerase-like enolase superfamily enzyme
MAAALHLVASTPNCRNPLECLILPDAAGYSKTEFAEDQAREEVKRHLLLEPFRVDGGHVAVPEGPGLGVQLNPEIVRKYADRPVDLG